MRGPLGNLHRHTLSHELFAIQVMARIIGVSVVLKLAESESIFEGYLAQPAVFPEEMLDVPFSGPVRQATQVHAG